MTEIIGELSAPGILNTTKVKRHEHHKIIISVSNFVSDVIIRIEEITSPSTNPVNLDELNRSFTLSENGDESFLLENMRIDNLRVNFVSGDATIKALYNGF